jgi:hypothetical protein
VKIKSLKPVLRTRRNLLEQVAEQHYEIRALADNRVKVQPKTSDSHTTVIKTLAEKHTELHTYKLKEERRYRVVLKNMHYSINLQEIKTEIENLGHTVTNIWDIKQYRTKQPLSMFFEELKPAPNKNYIFSVEYIQQCKIKFEPPKPKRDIAHCANCQRYGHTKIIRSYNF